MRARPDAAALALLVAIGVARAQPSGDQSGPGILGFGNGKSKEPITITSDNLEYAYKDGVIVYRGDVVAIQGDVKVHSVELRITLVKSDDPKNGGKPADALDSPSASKVREVVATGKVRIDQGTRWAVGGRATFDQSNRTLVLTENPVLHDGQNVVAGDRVVVFLDENRSVVEGGRGRVKATLFPSGDKAGEEKAGGEKPGGDKTPAVAHEAAAQ
jgi:lipopolysaccharide export system protein LptA